jgi:hypothetical protein
VSFRAMRALLPVVSFAFVFGCGPARAPSLTPSDTSPSAAPVPSASGDVPEPQVEGALEPSVADPLVVTTEPPPRLSTPRHGTVAPAEIEAALLAARHRMVACALRGTLVVRMVIAPDGSVTASVERNRLVKGEASCALDVVRALRMAPRVDDAAEALVPLVFR